jgi:alkanesulfonate monooxygenase SsuD/methylene tetrahydromethanopterin reductase-like flavin-dependent oxidoreductase (luciferase family)
MRGARGALLVDLWVGVGSSPQSVRRAARFGVPTMRPAAGNQRTTSVPCMNGWIVQWYA